MKNHENPRPVQRPQHGAKRLVTRGLIFVVVVAGILYSLSWIETYHERTHVERIASRIEHFREQYGHLPNPNHIEEMQALGFELRVGWHPDFVPLNETEYDLWFYYGFDGPHMVYHSHTKTWREEY
jgi:hypothetical protein